MTGSIIAYLTEKFGPECFASRTVFPFEFPTADGACAGIFDPYNRRLKLYDVQPVSLEKAPHFPSLIMPANKDSPISKVTVYSRPVFDRDWKRLGFRLEGAIEGYFFDGERTDLWAYYSDSQRSHEMNEDEHDRVVSIAQSKTEVKPELPPGISLEVVVPKHSQELSVFLKRIFDDYPSPLEPEHLERVIRTGAHHFLSARNAEGNLIAAASAEMDHEKKTAEMTDCATLPEYRGKGLMACLLSSLEYELPRRFEIYDCHTIARAAEISMNCVFAKLGYRYTGRLVNNCRMPNGWESMNLWCKKL